MLPIVKRRSCLFCQRDDQKITGEHVIGDWVSKLAGRGQYLAIRSASGPLSQQEQTWPTDRIAQMKVNDVCEVCNRTMGEFIETPASEALKPMIAGYGVTLTQDQQAAIALWLYKIGILYRYMAQPKREATREELDAIFIQRRPLAGTRVHVATYSGNFRLKLISYQVGLVKALAGKDFIEALRERVGALRNASPKDVAQIFKERQWDYGELVTIAVGNFCAQVALYPPHTSLAYRNASVVAQTWPVLGPVDWPLRFHFDDGGLDGFSRLQIP